MTGRIRGEDRAQRREGTQAGRLKGGEETDEGRDEPRPGGRRGLYS